MSVSLETVRRRERDALLGEYVIPVDSAGTQAPPYVAISSLVDLTTTPTQHRRRHPLGIEAFPTGDIAQGFVQCCASLNYKYLWLPPEDDSYRDKYIAFLKRHHGVSTALDGYDVDHLFNRQRAIDLNLTHVRMVLLGPGENRSHGAGYEKGRTIGRIGTPGRQRGIDEITLMKLCGIRSPRRNQPLTPEMLAHIQGIAAMFGLPPLEIERNIRDLMEVASFRPDHGA